MQKISIKHVNNQHNDWLRALDFYKQEIDILKSRLGEIATKNTGSEAMHKVEHYENAFKVQRDNIDRLNHDIRANITTISNQLQETNAGYIDSILRTQHNNLYEKFAAEENVLNNLRQDFNRFSAEWM